MGWTIGVLRFDFQQGIGIFLFTTMSGRALGLGSKNEWSYTSTPPIRRHGVVLS
jgi:hypothetical protein